MSPRKKLFFSLYFTAYASLQFGGSQVGYQELIVSPADIILRDGLGKSDRGKMLSKAEALAQAHVSQPDKVSLYYKRLAQAVSKKCGSLETCPKDSPLLQHALDLYESYRESPAYETWDKPINTRFARMLETDPVFADARARWDLPEGTRGHMDIKARYQIAERIMRFHDQAYRDAGLEPVTFRLRREDLAQAFPARKDSTMLVNYKNFVELASIPVWVINDIYLNHNDLMKLSLSEIAMGIAHECRHAVQRTLSNALETRRGLAYLDKHGLKSAAIMFKAVSAHLNLQVTDVNSPNAVSSYLKNPVERNASAGMSDAARIGMGLRR